MKMQHNEKLGFQGFVCI